MVYMGDPEPFDAQGLFVSDEKMRQANRIQTA